MKDQKIEMLEKRLVKIGERLAKATEEKNDKRIEKITERKAKVTAKLAELKK